MNAVFTSGHNRQNQRILCPSCVRSLCLPPPLLLTRHPALYVPTFQLFSPLACSRTGIRTNERTNTLMHVRIALHRFVSGAPPTHMFRWRTTTPPSFSRTTAKVCSGAGRRRRHEKRVTVVVKALANEARRKGKKGRARGAARARARAQPRGEKRRERRSAVASLGVRASGVAAALESGRREPGRCTRLRGHLWQSISPRKNGRCEGKSWAKGGTYIGSGSSPRDTAARPR